MIEKTLEKIHNHESERGIRTVLCNKKINHILIYTIVLKHYVQQVNNHTKVLDHQVQKIIYTTL